MVPFVLIGRLWRESIVGMQHSDDHEEAEEDEEEEEEEEDGDDDDDDHDDEDEQHDVEEHDTCPHLFLFMLSIPCFPNLLRWPTRHI